ncbi:MAG: AzlD domain-containing protein [Burkholderiaceae bacterium]|jgi:branched-subunit amino acid transport protein
MALDSTDIYVLSAIGLLTLCSIIARTTYFLFGDHIPLSENVRQSLRYAPVAALVGIIVPEVLPYSQGAGALLGVKFFAVIVAFIVFLRTRNALLVIVSGMVVFWLLKAIAVFN